MTSRKFLTSPIYYATGDPHIGHAYTTILCDVLARFYRQTGADVLFLTGMDEHGQKVQESAAEQGMEPRAFVDELAATFEAAWDQLDISYDRFIRTTEPEHIAVVTAFLERLWDKGLIYDAMYVGWYCIPDERYWTDKDVGEDRLCPDCGRPVSHVEERNYFFRMSDFQEPLIKHIEDNPTWIVPETRRNEVLGFLQKPLQDLSISRPRSRVRWGIPMPFDPEHTCYVWVDALTNYVTGSGVIDPEQDPDDRGFNSDTSHSRWPADLHLVGKDIITTHCVYWPTILMGVDLPLPRQVLAHGWWVAGETKMSKSLGNVVDPLALREDFGTDAVRWYLLRDMPTGSDASYTPERFLQRYGELANVLGNLASRTISMIGKYREGVIPEEAGSGMDAEIERTLEEVQVNMDAYRVHDALAAAMDLARAANGYVEEREPWAQAKDPERAGDLDETLVTLARVLAVLTALFEPVTPGKMADLAGRLGLARTPTLVEATTVTLSGNTVTKGEPLFPKAELLADLP